MKYTLNDKYPNSTLTTQCGKIFKKDLITELNKDIKEESFEVQQYERQKFIIPVTKKAEDIKKEIKEKTSELKEEMKDSEIEKPKGVSTHNLN